ncbi:hypothetical protein E0H58_26815 [Kribbella speibonae]|uniref:Uncharacterized protein n=1 Tax=Kribbella speibonae TaxID=1572660 RepID=A0ABY2A038_9ACTN|nr:hypothetical protein E0H58_26815 [Kribbella speibonae]
MHGERAFGVVQPGFQRLLVVGDRGLDRSRGLGWGRRRGRGDFAEGAGGAGGGRFRGVEVVARVVATAGAERQGQQQKAGQEDSSHARTRPQVGAGGTTDVVPAGCGQAVTGT